MAYILNTEILKNKSIFLGLRKILGIGKKNSVFFSKKIGCSINCKINQLSEEQIFKLLKFIDKSKILTNDDLKKYQLFVFKKLILIKSYRGLRRLKGLPVRGQRTHTNAKTAKIKKEALNFK